MQVIIAENWEKWDDWLRQNYVHNPFAQSWEWGEVLIAEGKKVERLAVVDGGRIAALAQVVYGSLPFGWQYAFCPMGPVCGDLGEDQRYAVYETLKNYLTEKKCIFLRIEPVKIIQETKKLLPKKTIDINPPATVVLNLSKTADELLAEMHPKTRYNIRLAEKKNIVIDNSKNFDVFWNLMKKTAARDNFKLHYEIHYKQLLASDLAGQTTAYYNHKPVACIVYFIFNGTATYLYGASDYNFRNLMAPYLLQWHALQLAKHAGCAHYDFFGVAPKVNAGAEKYEYDARHQYAGVTRFKLGFGGVPRQRPGTSDIVFSKGKYRLYKFLRAVRRLF